jgi:hypothetical protein
MQSEPTQAPAQQPKRVDWYKIVKLFLLALIALGLSNIADALSQSPLQEARAHARAIEAACADGEPRGTYSACVIAQARSRP